jgi:hypothetical protein
MSQLRPQEVQLLQPGASLVSERPEVRDPRSNDKSLQSTEEYCYHSVTIPRHVNDRICQCAIPPLVQPTAHSLPTRDNQPHTTSMHHRKLRIFLDLFSIRSRP